MQFQDGLVEVVVACPLCLNLNRKARRACKNCNHTGKVKKIVPVDNIIEKGDDGR